MNIQANKRSRIRIIVFCLSTLLLISNKSRAGDPGNRSPTLATQEQDPLQSQSESPWERITTFEAEEESYKPLFSDLCECWKPGLWLTEIRVHGTDVIIQGYTLGRPFQADFITFIRMLHFADSLQEIRLSYTRPVVHSSHEIREFQLQAVRVFPHTREPITTHDLTACPDFFTPLVIEQRGHDETNEQPSPSRTHPLQAFAIQDLQLTTIMISASGGYAAYVRTPQGKLYEVVVGTPIGRQQGHVTVITRDGLCIHQQIQQDENLHAVESDIQLPCEQCTVKKMAEP